ncbi:hypothetical protein DFH27DRAFT_656786 [Peziza echinospora]|nr:hypothetical protein DFH27DRAFT_656786 [Peziza echinospora]
MNPGPGKRGRGSRGGSGGAGRPAGGATPTPAAQRPLPATAAARQNTPPPQPSAPPAQPPSNARGRGGPASGPARPHPPAARPSTPIRQTGAARAHVSPSSSTASDSSGASSGGNDIAAPSAPPSPSGRLSPAVAAELAAALTAAAHSLPKATPTGALTYHLPGATVSCDTFSRRLVRREAERKRLKRAHRRLRFREVAVRLLSFFGYATHQIAVAIDDSATHITRTRFCKTVAADPAMFAAFEDFLAGLGGTGMTAGLSARVLLTLLQGGNTNDECDAAWALLNTDAHETTIREVASVASMLATHGLRDAFGIDLDPKGQYPGIQQEATTALLRLLDKLLGVADCTAIEDAEWDLFPDRGREVNGWKKLLLRLEMDRTKDGQGEHDFLVQVKDWNKQMKHELKVKWAAKMVAEGLLVAPPALKALDEAWKKDMEDVKQRGAEKYDEVKRTMEENAEKHSKELHLALAQNDEKHSKELHLALAQNDERHSKEMAQRDIESKKKHAQDKDSILKEMRLAFAQNDEKHNIEKENLRKELYLALAQNDEKHNKEMAQGDSESKKKHTQDKDSILKEMHLALAQNDDKHRKELHLALAQNDEKHSKELRLMESKHSKEMRLMESKNSKEMRLMESRIMEMFRNQSRAAQLPGQSATPTTTTYASSGATTPLTDWDSEA